MASYNLVVLSNPVAGKEDEYNEWYTNIHIPDVVRCEGFTGGRRFKLGQGFDAEHKYMAIYEMETNDPAAVIAGMTAKAGTPELSISPALDQAGVAMTLYEAITPRIAR
jgi:hypothetical protein